MKKIDEDIEKDCWIYEMYEMKIRKGMMKCVLIV
jgi:hypothetical protein